MGTYAAVTDVDARLPGRPALSASTQPTSTAVSDWIDIAEGRVEAALRAVGITVPVTDSRGILIIKDLVLAYAVGRTEAALASAGGDGANDAGQEKLAYFDAEIEKLRMGPSGASAELEGGSADDGTRRVRCHTLDHPDGKSVAAGDFDPTFTRDEVW